MIFVHLLLHLLLHLFPHLSFEGDGDPDGLIISPYLRRCVSLGIVPHRVLSLHLPHLHSVLYLNVKMDHFDFSVDNSHVSPFICVANLYFTSRDEFQLLPWRHERCSTRIGLLPVFAGRGRRPPLLNRAHDVASVPSALIGGNLRFRRRITNHDGDARSLLLLLRKSIWMKEERFSAVDSSFQHFSEMGIDSRACLASPWQRLMRLRVLRLDNWWIEEVTERNVMTVFGVGDGNECSWWSRRWLTAFCRWNW